MKQDALQKYVNMRMSLLKEKVRLEAQLDKIMKALGEPPPPVKDASGRRIATRPRNKMPLRDLVYKLLAGKPPMSKKELLDTILNTGYIFASSNPMGSLNTLLYSDKKIRNVDGKFTLTGAAAAKAAAAAKPAAAPKPAAK